MGGLLGTVPVLCLPVCSAGYCENYCLLFDRVPVTTVAQTELTDLADLERLNWPTTTH